MGGHASPCLTLIEPLDPSGDQLRTFLFRAGRYHGANASWRGRITSILGGLDGAHIGRKPRPGRPVFPESNNHYEAASAGLSNSRTAAF